MTVKLLLGAGLFVVGKQETVKQLAKIDLADAPS